MSEQTASLIKAVRKRPYLFDTSHEYYKNIVKKAEAWDEIASELNLSSDMAKVKWKNLRDSYIRHKKSIQNSKGQDKKYVKWPWSNQMMFLDNCCLRGKTQNPRTTGLRENKTSVIVPPTEASGTFKPLKIPLPKEKTEAASSPPAEAAPNKNQDEDAVNHLFLSYAETFKKFRPTTQAVIKLQLATLFSRTELNELQEKDVPKVSHLMTITSPCEGHGFILKNNVTPTPRAKPNTP